MRRLALAASVALLSAVPGLAQDQDASRVLSLGGTVTEIVFALDQQDRLIGRDTTSGYPPQALELPDVGYMRQLSPEGVLSVGPDLILSDEGSGPPEAIAVLKAAGIPFVEVPDGFGGEAIALKVTTIAEALGVPERGQALADRLRGELDEVARRNARQDDPRRVLFVLSTQGGRVMAGGEGTSADAIIALAGGRNAISGVQGYKQITDEAIAAAAPDVILMMDRSRGGPPSGSAEVLAMPAFAPTPAARDGALIHMDGLLLLGFGPRTAEAAAELHRALYGNEGEDGDGGA